MKVYKKCEPCKSDGLILCGGELLPCENCNGVGYTATEIPIEQMLKSLKRTYNPYGPLCGVEDVSTIESIKEAIEAAEGVLK